MYFFVQEGALISIIKVKSRLLILKKSAPSTFVEFLDFFHPPLLVYYSYILGFFYKKSHPPRLFQPPFLPILKPLHHLHIYSNLHVY